MRQETTRLWLLDLIAFVALRILKLTYEYTGSALVPCVLSYNRGSTR
jgi:hypothetical protein